MKSDQSGGEIDQFNIAEFEKSLKNPLEDADCAWRRCDRDGVVVTPQGPMCDEHADELARRWA